MTPEIIGAVAAGVGVLLTALFTAVTAMLVKAAKAARDDRAQFLEFIAGFVHTSPMSNDDSNSGRTNLLVEQTHERTGDLARAIAAMTKSTEHLAALIQRMDDRLVQSEALIMGLAKKFRP